MDQKDVPEDIKTLKEALTESKVVRGTDYYIRQGEIVYTCWRDSRPVLAMSVSYPGHKLETQVTRRMRHQQVQYSNNKFLVLSLLRSTINLWEALISQISILPTIMYSGRQYATGKHLITLST